jgi:hypothetical protein
VGENETVGSGTERVGGREQEMERENETRRETVGSGTEKELEGEREGEWEREERESV